MAWMDSDNDTLTSSKFVIVRHHLAAVNSKYCRWVISLLVFTGTFTSNTHHTYAQFGRSSGKNKCVLYAQQNVWCICHLLVARKGTFFKHGITHVPVRCEFLVAEAVRLKRTGQVLVAVKKRHARYVTFTL